MNLIQFIKNDGKRAVGAIEGGKAHIVKNATSVYALALKAAADGVKLKALVGDKGLGKADRSGRDPQGGPPAAAGRSSRSGAPASSPAPASPIWARPRRATRCTSPTSRPPKRR